LVCKRYESLLSALVKTDINALSLHQVLMNQGRSTLDSRVVVQFTDVFFKGNQCALDKENTFSLTFFTL